ncbi:hypothetical protein CC1G_01749 [Coprinopsis cinerea okayama7|uniref:Mid2 domain-containing protein n=1 Tax=Coprinopsis cinerea (strain Okayama-7 / 130 / ATCC MYA-4618 / FGSC 9003) TaxID=240176 RepID=A8N2A9_COPC7|nr:hypothetical protein CC1G_01749 [Coprinopsis cinerea okayama7\|eukprot:XP_001829069.1 hypothetical protein CC1G_01749 [Coprinopsis cinerea okayama7\
MPPLSSKTTTFLAYLTLILAVSAAVVEAHEPLRARGGHASLKRIIRKRAPQDSDASTDSGFPFPPIIGAAPIPSASESASESATPSSVLSGSASASASVSASAEPSASASVSASVSASGSVSGSASASASASASESESASATPSATPAEEEEEPIVTDTPAQPTERSTSTRVAQTKTVIHDVEVEATAPPSMAGAAADDQSKSNIVTILIAVVASVGGVFILWTVFRKWKLGSSKKFDRRLQPIDWEKPTHEDDRDPGIIPSHRRHSGSSLNSSGHGHGSARSNTNFGLPEHDFTAGPAHLSPVGGYADMSRGPSPGPQFGGYAAGPRY